MASILVSHALLDVEDVRRFLGIDTNTSIDANETLMFEELINAVTETLEDKLGRKIKQQTITDEVYTVNSVLKVDTLGRAYYTIPTFLQLNNFPLITLTSIKFDDVTQTITEGTTTGFYYTASDLLKEGKLYYSAGWPTAPRTIKITYVCGWVTVPYWIQNLAKEIILFNWQKSMFGNSRNILINNSSDGVKSISGTPQYRSLNDIWAHFKEELAPYQRHYT